MDIYGTASASEDDNQIEPEFSDDDEPQDDAPKPDIEDSENESSAREEGEESHSLWGNISKAWNNRSTELDHDWAITGWVLGVMPEVYKDAREMHVVRKLMTYPYPNKFPNFEDKSEDEIVDLFWDEFKTFCNKTALFDKPAGWNSKSARLGRSWIWHEKYSRPHTKVLGIIACKVTSKNLGMSPCERNWDGMKEIKTGNKIQISSEGIN